MEELIQNWEKQRLDILESLRTNDYNDHNFKKLTYKALQLKYCIKDLRELKNRTNDENKNNQQ